MNIRIGTSLVRIVCGALATLVIAGIIVPNLMRTEAASSLSTMAFAGVSVSYNPQNVMFASLGEVAGALLVFLVTCRSLSRKRQ